MIERGYERYSWTRYWSRLEEEPPETSPFQSLLRYSAGESPPRPGGRQLRDLTEEKCQVLIGEAGSGKSDELYQLEKHLESEDDQVMSVSLGKVGETAFIKTLEALGDERSIYFLLDGLDETSIRNPIALLQREIQNRSEGDVYLRVTCRSGYWAFRSPEFLGHLNEVWSEVGVYEIEPLGKKDVLLAASEEGIAEPEDFWANIKDVGVEPLTRKPVTLNFLLEEYCDGEENLPTTRTELYNSACRRLCEEDDPNRVEESRLSKQERLRLSERMAAVSMFSQRQRIWLSPSFKDSPEESLSIEDFIAGTEDFRPEDSYDIKDFIEASNTGLLHGATPSEDAIQSVEWVERTLAEFLAARFVIRQNMDLGQLLDLLAAPDDETRGIAPQMQEIAGWISRWHHELFEHLLKTDPQFVLLGDAAALSPKKRSRLSARLLQQYERKRLRPTNAWNFGTQHLSNPDLPDQLREYLKPEYDTEVRSVAINLIQLNEVESLADEVFSIACGEDEPHRLRVSSVNALGAIGSLDQLAGLATQLDITDKEDPARELRGSILSVICPDVLDVENILSNLEPPREKDSFTYKQFIEKDLFNEVDDSNIIPLFDLFEDWIESSSSNSTGSIFHLPRVLESFANQLFLAASSHTSEEEIRSRLAGWIYTLTKSYQDLPGRGTARKNGFPEKWDTSESLRSTVLDAILDNDDPEYIHLSHGNQVLSPRRDLELVLEKAKDEANPKKQKRWAKLGTHLFSCDQVDDVVSYLQVASVREAFLKNLGRSPDLSSEAAAEALREHCEEKKRKREEQTEQLDQPAGEDEDSQVTPTQIEALLNASDNLDEMEKWPSVYNLIYRDTGPGDDISDITDRASWELADSELRQRLIEAASAYLSETQPDPSTWKTSPSVWGQAELTSVAALRLLQKESPNRLENWEDDRWRRWAPLVVAYEPVTDEDHTDLQRLAERAYERVPAVVKDTLQHRIQARSEHPEHPGSVPVLRTLERAWDEPLIEVLLGEALNPNLNTRTLSEILPIILENGSAEDVGRVESLLEKSGADEQNQGQRAAEAAIALIRSSRDKFWDVVWPHLDSNDEFARRVVGRLAHRARTHDSEIIEDLTTEELGALYLRLTDLYPHEDDIERPSGEAHWVSTRDKVRSFRSAVLKALVSRGAAEQIERIREERPYLKWLTEPERQAEEEARKRAWSPHSPEDILELASGQRARLGRSGAELLSAVEDALKALNERLRRHTPAVYDLWSSVTRNRALRLAHEIIQEYEGEITDQLDEDRSSQIEEALEVLWRKRSGNVTHHLPKEETELSDYVQRYLRRVLEEAVVSREVNVSPGNHTDLHVSTFTREEGDEKQDIASVVVEIKGSWNRKVYKGIQNQLVEDYLAEASCRFGLYFVGWHYCEAWSDSDPRKDRARRGGLESHRDKLRERVAGVDQEGIAVRLVVTDLSLPD